jgi:hypothetical protein
MRRLDPILEEAYRKVSEETGVPVSRVASSFIHFINWNRQSMSGRHKEVDDGLPEYAAYMWSRFGTFTYDAKTFIRDKEEVKEYYNNKAIKDKNRNLDLSSLTDEDIERKQPIIDRISSYHPSRCPSKYKTYAWWNGGEVQEGDWNVKSMLLEEDDDLNDCLKLLENESE